VVCCVLICMLEVLDVPEVMRCALLCMLEVLEMSETMCCAPALFARGVGDVGRAGRDTPCATLYAEGCGRWTLMLEVLDVPEVMRCALLCMLEVLEMSETMCCALLYLLEVLKMLDVLDVIRRVLDVIRRVGRDTPCATLYAEGYGGWTLMLEVFDVPEIIALCATACWGCRRCRW